MATYAHPDALVTTAWVADHLDDPTVRLIEVDIDATSYAAGHLPRAVQWTVWGDLLDDDERLPDDPAILAELLSRSGITQETTIVLYGDASNWGAALAYWVLRAVGHQAVHLMDGGRATWLADGRPTTTDAPDIAATDYPVPALNWSHRARREDVLAAITSGETVILDARLRAEYDGELFRPSGPPAAGQRAGHIPGAIHVPWELSRSRYP